jgi:Fe-S oxidoreductase
MLAMTEYAKRRMEAAREKAEQIKATGAKIVATSCHNCLDQLLEINRHYRLGVQVKLLVELVSSALALEPRPGYGAGG